MLDPKDRKFNNTEVVDQTGFHGTIKLRGSYSNRDTLKVYFREVDLYYNDFK